MLSRIIIFVATVSVVTVQICGETRIATARLVSQNVTGSILFTETAEGLHVTGGITGLPVGLYGFHVHALGDIENCDATGSHFDPYENNHGGRDHAVRHVGDLGNVEFVGNNTVVAVVDFVDTMITLRGRNSILGRGLVLHERKDDLGLGGHETSLTTGNAGARVACGVIGIKSPAEPWNSAPFVAPSVRLMCFLSAFMFYFRY